MDPTTRFPRWQKLVLVLLLVLGGLALLVVFFPWDLMRGPINRYVSEKTGRHFAITRHLDVTLGRTARVRADGIEFANPSWAHDPDLLRAEGADLQIRVWPLLHGRIEIPAMTLRKPVIGLQEDAEGRRTWDLSKPGSAAEKSKSQAHVPLIGHLSVDDGQLHYIAAPQRVDVQANLHTRTGPEAGKLPLAFDARGTYRDQPFEAQGATGNVVQLARALNRPFPAEIHLKAVNTVIDASGSVTQLAPLSGLQGEVSVQGRNLADLYHVLGVVLPESPHYALQAQVASDGDSWHATNIRAKLGASDLSGDLTFDKKGNVPALSGSVMSARLDFDDLAPLVGLPEQRHSAQAIAKATGTKAEQVPATQRKASTAGTNKVLPDRTLDLKRLHEMNADVRYTATRIVNLNTIPVDSAKLHVRLAGGVLQLDDLDLGFAGGRLQGAMRIDGNSDPAASQLHAVLRNVDLTKLVSGSRFEKYLSLGRIHGDVDLRARGNSTAAMLGSADGKLAMLMGHARMSKLASQAADLHVGEVVGLLIGGDRDIDVRCAAAAFDVQRGLMRSRALLLDTSDTALYGNAEINLAKENMDVVVRQYPKEKSLLSLRAPLRVDGPFAKPAIHVDKTSIAAKGGASVALGALTPLLALAATIETAPGKDADCTPVLRQAAGPAAAGQMEKAANQAARSEIEQGSTHAMGAGGAEGFMDRLRMLFGRVTSPQDTTKPGMKQEDLAPQGAGTETAPGGPPGAHR